MFPKSNWLENNWLEYVLVNSYIIFMFNVSHASTVTLDTVHSVSVIVCSYAMT